VRGVQDPGWDPYESSLQAIDQMRALHRKADTFEAARHLQLWLYGHIIEASEPYEILANLVAICDGDTWRTDRFPAQGNRPQSPGTKIKSLKEAATKAGLPEAAAPLEEIWDRDLRNAIFHSDYSVHGTEVRFRRDGWPCSYADEQILVLVNRALAYFDVLRFLLKISVRNYSAPKMIMMHPLNAGTQNEQATVMVREGFGAIGLKHAWSLDELRRGYIPWSYGRFRLEELQLADADPLLAFFPAVLRRDETERQDDLTSTN
jgi:hypothetical protein